MEKQEKKVREVTKSYGFSIYPRIRKMQLKLAKHYNMSLTRLVMELIEEKYNEIFGKDNADI